MDDDVRNTVIKVAAMLVLVFAEWWAMQPYHESLLARFYQVLATLFYRMAGTFGKLGLTCEANYYEAVQP